MIKHGKPAYKHEHPDVVKSVIDVQRQAERSIKINFKAETKGLGIIHVYYDGKFIKTIKINMAKEMEM